MRRLSTSSDVVASTAGADNWQTWAGRSHGSDQFEFLDLFRGVKRKFNKQFVWGIPPAGTACPICLCVPDKRRDWHVTSACGHATCRDCLRGYASSLVRDPGHHGPLKCPVCPLPLRPKDAIRALTDSDPELLTLWDAKIRDEVLRALPGYRHCPRCNGSNSSSSSSSHNSSHNSSGASKDGSTGIGNNTRNNASNQKTDKTSSSLVGGGFVTPECLAPINHRREEIALGRLNHPLMSHFGLVACYFLYLYIYFGSIHSSSVFVDIFNASIVPFWLVRRLWLYGRHVVAADCRRVLFEPITVECPCCDEAFILNAEAELGNTVIADEATEQWIGSNTRACPRCSVPISKIDGCNHMQCGHCRARFCWACMRVGSACRAFNCRHGAPFGNAGTDEDLAATEEGQNDQDRGILNRIDRMTAESTRWDRRDTVLFGVIGICFLARETAEVQFIAKCAVTSFAFLFSSGTFFILPMLLLSATLRNRGIRNAAAGVAADIFDVDNAVERRMIRDAVRRSLVEQ